MKRPVKLSTLNELDQAGFVGVCGPLFEHSPWIAERTYARKPFASVADLHATLLHQMGLDPNKLSYFHGGLDQKLVGVEVADPIRQII